MRPTASYRSNALPVYIFYIVSYATVGLYIPHSYMHSSLLCRIKKVDLIFMSAISQIVPIIPVITKADTMTIREAQNYKQEVFNRLQVPEAIRLCR